MNNNIWKMGIKRNEIGDLIKAMFGAINLSLMSTNILVVESDHGYYVEKFHWGYAVAIVALIFLMVKIMPFTRLYENTWVFLFTFIAFIPLNIKLTKYLNEMIFGLDGIMGVIWDVILWFIIVSVEEIVMGIMTRFMWRKQKEFG